MYIYTYVSSYKYKCTYKYMKQDINVYAFKSKYKDTYIDIYIFIFIHMCSRLPLVPQPKKTHTAFLHRPAIRRGGALPWNSATTAAAATV